MKKAFFAGLLMLFVLSLSSFGMHKFYVSIYQVNYVPEKKMLQITSRIFIDDINNALGKKYKKKFHLGDTDETSEDVAKMQQYILDNFVISVNNKPKTLEFRSKEMENNVLICYFRITDIPKITYLGITNKCLFDFVTEQQNIIQTTIYGKKNSLLLTTDEPSGALKFPSPVY
ncbi:MAG TPA: DUF6702 family protein [Flavobacterium sp.]|nr:DUF6702 family protein [Flavobacterium sp.]